RKQLDEARVKAAASEAPQASSIDGLGGYHLHSGQDLVPPQVPGWERGENGHWQEYAGPTARPPDPALREFAGRDLPRLPEGNEEALALIRPAWEVVARLAPELAGKIKRVLAVDPGQRKIKGMLLDDGTLVVRRGQLYSAQSLYHELVHIEQRLRNPGDKNYMVPRDQRTN